MYLEKINYALVGKETKCDILRVLFPYISFKDTEVVEIDESLVEIRQGEERVRVSFEGCGSFVGRDQYGNFIMPANIPKAIDVLFNSQWIDPNKELPENDFKVIIKTACGILNATYRKDFKDFIISCYTSTPIDNLSNYSHILGWLPADNVVM